VNPDTLCGRIQSKKRASSSARVETRAKPLTNIYEVGKGRETATAAALQILGSRYGAPYRDADDIQRDE
jgi:hypothetical protein